MGKRTSSRKWAPANSQKSGEIVRGGDAAGAGHWPAFETKPFSATFFIFMHAFVQQGHALPVASKFPSRSDGRQIEIYLPGLVIVNKCRWDTSGAA